MSTKNIEPIVLKKKFNFDVFLKKSNNNIEKKSLKQAMKVWWPWCSWLGYRPAMQ
jgi:hypothetical protein